MPVQRVQGHGGGAQYKRFVDGCCPPIIGSYATVVTAPNPGVLSPPLPGVERMIFRLPADALSQVVIPTQRMDDPAAGQGASAVAVIIPTQAPVGATPTVTNTSLAPGVPPGYDLFTVDLNAAGGNVGDFFDLILTNDCGCCINVLLEIIPAIP